MVASSFCPWINSLTAHRIWSRAAQHICPFNIILSIAIFLAFTKFKIKNSIVNKLAASAFSVYLIHENPFISPYYRGIARNCFENGNLTIYIFTVITLALTTYIICFCINQLRIYSWKRIQPRTTSWVTNLIHKFILKNK